MSEPVPAPGGDLPEIAARAELPPLAAQPDQADAQAAQADAEADQQPQADLQLGADLPLLSELAGGTGRVVATAVAGAAVFVAAGLARPVDTVLLPALAAAGAAAGVSFWTDIRHRVIPNSVTVPAALAVWGLTAVADLAGAEGAFVGGLVGGLVALLLYGFQALLLPMSMGMGDAKLAPSLFTVAGFLGYGPWRNTLLAISIVGALASLSLLLAKRLKGRKAKFAYGPSMVVGAVIALLV